MKMFQSKDQCFFSSDYYICYVKCRPSDYYPNSEVNCYHDFFEAELFLSCAGNIFVNSIPYNVKKGFFYMLRPMDYHHYNVRLAEEDYIRFYNLKFTSKMVSGRILDQIKGCAPPLASYFGEEDYDAVLSELKEIDSLYSKAQRDGFDESVIENRIERICLIMIKCLSSAPDPAESDIPKIHLALNYIHENFTSNISVADTAGVLGYTPNYFSAYFKNNVSMSFVDYVNGLRLGYAVSMMNNTGLSVKEIASKAGFNSPEYFTRLFKRKYGTTPRNYSKRKKAP